MMSFMLGVLGSLIFWLGYGVASLIIAAFIMRSLGRASFSYIVLSTGKHPIRFPHHHNDNGESVYCYKAGDEDATLGERTAAIFGLLGHMVFWPLIAVIYGGYHLFKLFAAVFFGGSSKVMQYLFKVLPNVEIKVKKEEKKEKKKEKDPEESKWKVDPRTLLRVDPSIFFTGNFHGGDFLVNMKGRVRANDPWPAHIELHGDGKRLNIKWTNGHQAIVSPDVVNIWYMFSDPKPLIL